MTASVDLTASNSQMQTVLSWEELTPFAGKVIAYQANAYFLQSDKIFVMEDRSVCFGYIESNPSMWNSGEKGYNMHRLQTPETSLGTCALTDSQLKTLFSVRLATDYEKTQLIAQAIFNEEAKFEHIPNAMAIEILSIK